MAMSYSTGEVATLLGTSQSTAIRLIDQHEISGFFMPGKRRDRRVTHGALIAFVRRNPGFRFALQNLSGYHAGDDFPESDEPLPTPAHPVRAAHPRSAHKPRSAKGGMIPEAASYSASEVGFVLGLSRRSVISKLDRGILRGIQLPATGLTSWTWRIPRGWLEKFLRDNPAYSYGWNRLGLEAASSAAMITKAKRKESSGSPSERLSGV
jgi:excisionase family DNA binding protein